MKKLLAQMFHFALLVVALTNCAKKEETPTPVPTPGVTDLAITSVNPSSGPEGSTVIISGTGFSTTPTNNIVKFGAITANVDSASASRIVTKVPKGANTGKVTVEIGGKTVASGTGFTVSTPVAVTLYKSVSFAVHSSTFPKGGLYDPSLLYLNDKIYSIGGSAPETNLIGGYVGAYDSDNFWEYDIASKKWTQLAKVPITSMSLMGSTLRFVYKNKIYIGSKTELYEYDFTTSKWSLKSKFSNMEFGSCQIVFGDKLYALTIYSGQTSKVLDLNTFEIKNISNFPTEAGTWSIGRAAVVKDNRIYFWVTKRNVAPVDGKAYTAYYDTQTGTYTNLGMPANLVPQAAVSFDPRVAFEKDGIFYGFYYAGSGSFFLYNPAFNVTSSLKFDLNQMPLNKSLELVTDGKGTVYDVLGDYNSGLLPTDPKRFDKNVYEMKFSY